MRKGLLRNHFQLPFSNICGGTLLGTTAALQAASKQARMCSHALELQVHRSADPRSCASSFCLRYTLNEASAAVLHIALKSIIKHSLK